MSGARRRGLVWWPAPAKLNLFLHITGRRADGYHELQTVFRLLDWGDRIGLRLREDGQVRRQGEGLAGVAEADDLAVRAARLLKEANVAQGADIIVEKHVPAGGGFGGGSSDAATVLVVLNRLWRPAWTRTRWPRWACAWAPTCRCSCVAAMPGPKGWASACSRSCWPRPGMWWLNRAFMFPPGPVCRPGFDARQPSGENRGLRFRDPGRERVRTGAAPP
jgi:hypothetical protein